MNLKKLVCAIFRLFLSSRNKPSRTYTPPRHISPLSLLAVILAYISPLNNAFEKACEVIFKVFQYLILIVIRIQPIFSFTELVTCNLKAFQKSILKNLTKFTAKHLCWSLFFFFVAGLSLVTLL